MSRTKRSAKLDTRSSRLDLTRGEAHQEPFAKGRYLAYRRPQNGAAGSWIARWKSPEGKFHQIQLGAADDFSDANGLTILNYGQAQKRAEAWWDEQDRLAVMKADGEVPHTGPYTVSDAIREYLEDGRRRGTKGVEIYAQVARTRILPELGTIEVSKLTRKRIEDWHMGLALSGRIIPKRVRHEDEQLVFADAPTGEDGQRGRKSSANRYLTILKRALNLAMIHHKVTGSAPWREVKPFKAVEKARTRFLTPEEQVRLVNACPPDFRRLVQGALFLGARYGELARLRVQDINAKAGTVWVGPRKTEKGRHVVLTEEGKGFFQTLCAGRGGQERVFLRDQATRTTRTDAGSEWASSDQKALMAAACKAAKVEALTFHELRHTYASGLVNAGVPLAYVAAQLGHSSTRMVERFYGHLAPSALAEAIRALPALGIADEAKVATLRLKKA